MADEKVCPSFKEFKILATRGNLIPVYKEISADLETPVSTFLKLAANEPYAYLLESAEGGERWGRYSFISWAPRLIYTSKGARFSAERPGTPFQWKSTTNPLLELKSLMAGFRPVGADGLPRFWGGAVGFISYDMVRFFEELPSKPKDTLDLPDALFMLTDKLVIFDHLAHAAKIVVCVDARENADYRRLYANAEREIGEIISRLRKPLGATRRQARKPGRTVSNVPPERFNAMVRKVKRYIRAGDIVQSVISQRFARPTPVGGLEIYRGLRTLNPSPYMYYFKAGDVDIIGSSPEILVRKEDDTVETRPIAGTRPRGATVEREKGLARELLADPKERAEHIMLVDLGRNDISRVCEPATVHVPELMVIEKYSHVMHIVSSVQGKLSPGLDAFEVLKACFPAGTVSGAPKVRAMEIIDELEPTARGPYAGAVGYFSYSGNMDMAITIRTIVLKDGTAFCQAGAGIVADSVPEMEYRETKNKAAALFAAIDKAERGIE